MAIYKYDLVHELMRSSQLDELLLDDDFSQELYAALCNMRWFKIPEDDADNIMHRLTHLSPEDFSFEECWSVSWRGAGGVVADLRNPHLRKAGKELEDYMSWYCSGNEGEVSDRIRETLKSIGWQPIQFPQSTNKPPTIT